MSRITDIRVHVDRSRSGERVLRMVLETDYGEPRTYVGWDAISDRIRRMGDTDRNDARFYLTCALRDVASTR